jgi:hypothetical protein
LSTPSDMRLLEETPRAVSSFLCPTRGCPVVTFVYHDGRERVIECRTDEDIDRAQALAERLHVRL